MKLLLFLVPISLAFLFSCRQRHCNETDFTETTWEEVSNTIKYSVCESSDDSLQLTDSIRVILLGTLSENNKLTKSPFDSLMFHALFAWPLGTLSVGDTAIQSVAKGLLGHLKKHSVNYIKLQFLSGMKTMVETKAVVYFSGTSDSLSTASWLDTVRSFSYIDSVKYISKNTALNTYLQDNTDFSNVLKENPLPASAELYFKPPFYRTGFLDSVRSNFLNLSFVTDMSYSSPQSSLSLRQINKLINTPFIIKIVN